MKNKYSANSLTTIKHSFFNVHLLEVIKFGTLIKTCDKIYMSNQPFHGIRR